MTTTLMLTIAPIFMLVLLGYLLRRIGLLKGDFWTQSAKLGYWVLLPALLFYKISTADIDLGLTAPFAGILASSFFAAGAVTLVVTRIIAMPVAEQGSTLQGVVRHNSFMALAIAEALFGAEGLSLAALASAVLALVTNLSIIPALLSLDARKDGRVGMPLIARSIVKNPFILSILAGLLANFLLPDEIPIVHDTAGLVGSAALPVMLLCVGAGLRLKGLKTQIAPLTLSVLGRFVLFPVLVLILASGLETQTVLILLIFAAVPTAPSSTALAAETGGDVPVMKAVSQQLV
ncbi:AEC family transporter [uncultured Sulfitobacter sp.]|uniref:AEC family transporter n=1 Tax=uncultured Sulfitobacter sp. TaxID=191468 RepID=UPI0030DD61A1|tara:strand:- start:21 stop:893 length:873 start_codon:yes stop_codon:yes gene_type:complete